jgi:amino acid adenylation domain-containing protein
MKKLLEKLNQLNIKLSLNGSDLNLQAPKGAVTPDILKEIKEHKNEIITFLENFSSKRKIQKTEEKEFYPLSSAQKRLWLMHQMNSENVAYHIPMMFEIKGDLDVVKLEKTFRYIIKKHESLRTFFEEDSKGNPVQIIKEFYEDLFKLNYKDNIEDINEEIRKTINLTFNITKDLLFRGNLFKISEEKYLLLIVMHHIVSDGWSIEVFAKDFFDIYKNIDNEHFNLDDLSIQYKDYSVWQQEKIKSEDKNKEYWSSIFSGEIPVLELPSKTIRPRSRSGRGTKVSLQIDEQILSQFQKVCSDKNATLFMGIKTVVDILLFKYSHQNDIIVGTAIANREYVELQNQIGFYANTLALRSYVNSAKSFLDLLEENKTQLLDAYKYQEYPFDELVANLRLTHDPSRNPLFDVMVSLEEKSKINTSQLEGLEIKKIIIDTNSSKFDLDFSFFLEDSKLNLDLIYDCEIYDCLFVNNLIKHLNVLIERIIVGEDLLISNIDFLLKEERQQILVEFNDTKLDYPGEKTIVELFEEQVENTPDNVAVVFEGKKLTYKDLNEQANQLGVYLRENFVIQADDLIAINLERSEKMIVAIMGILKSGAAYVPIDPEYPQERINFIKEDTRAKITINEEFLEIFKDSGETKNYNRENLPIISGADNLAYIIYTSGTTGQPKGVMIENKNLSSYVFAFRNYFKIDSYDVMLSLSTIAFDTSIEEIFPVLIVGGKLVIAKNNKDFEDLIQICKKESVTKLSTNPYIIEYLNLNSKDIDELKLDTLISGGDKLQSSHISQLINKIDIYNTYGPTESTVCCSYFQITNDLDKILIGRPISNTQVYILDSDLSIVPVGVSGKLYVSGAGLARGYLNRPDLTAEKFVANPFKLGAKMYDTGDLARWLPDGNIEFLGRKDFQVKIRGYRIELGEIEVTISQFSKHIRQIVVDAREVKGDKALIAYYTTDEPELIDKTILREYLQSKLPDYMVPGFLVELESIPLTPNGKIDRKALPDVSGEDLIRREFLAPRNETEQKLKVIFEEVLGINKVGITDNFFEMGGHSLMVAQVLNKIHRNLAMQISFKDFFAYPTVEGISENLSRKDYAPIPKATEQHSYPLTPSQQRLWVLSQLEGGSQAYNMPSVVTLKGELNIEYFERAFGLFIDRHEITRTLFKTDKVLGEIRQYITPKDEVNFKIEILDFTEKVQSDVEDYLQAANSEVFNLEQSPLIRASLLKKADQEFLFFLSMHHIIGDGWSTEVLISEVVGNYNNLLVGESNLEGEEKLVSLTIQYKDYAVWLQQEIKGEKYQNAEVYWLEQLKGDLPVIELPSYKTRPLKQTYNGDNLKHIFSEEFTEKLTKYSDKHGVTLFMTLMTGINALLYRYTGQHDIIVGTPIAGREHPDLENQIGLYLNTLAIRTRFEESNNAFESLLHKEKDTLLSAYENQMYPFDELVSKLNIKRNTSHSALFDVLVVFQNQSQLQFSNREKDIVGLQIEGYDYHRKTSQFDISYIFAEENGQLGLTIEYNTDIYDTVLIGRMFSHFENLLYQVIENEMHNGKDSEKQNIPNLFIEDIDFLTKQERHQLLVEFNDTVAEYPKDKTIIQLFEQQVEKNLNKAAVFFEGKELTYKSLNEQANQLGDYLRQNYKIQSDDLIAIKLERSEKMIVVILGILKSGAAYVPIDPDYPQDRIDYIEEDTRAKVTIDEDFLETFAEQNGSNTYLKENLPIISRPDSLAYVIYTSGTTGQPKGVMMQQGNILNLIIYHIETIFPYHKVTFLSNPSFDVSFQEIFSTLLCGATLYPIADIIKKDIQELTQFISKNQLDCLFFPTAYFKILIEDSSFLECIGENVKHIIVAGEKLILNDIIYEKIKETSIKIHNHYGPAETHVVTTYIIDENCDKTIIPPIGKPIANTSVYILDSNNFLCSMGKFGKVYLSGKGVAKGYLNKNKLTAEKFIENPFVADIKMYDTGDIARWLPSGNIEFLGRKDTQVKVRGYRVETNEIEVILSNHESLKQVIVDVQEINGDNALIAYFVKKDPKEKLENSLLRNYMLTKVPEYMVPNFILEINSIPLTPNGKIDRQALPIVTAKNLIKRDYIAPKTENEGNLVKIWSEILGVEKIGVTDNFFELGGNSLKLIVLSNKYKKIFNSNFKISELFKNPDIKSHLRFIEVNKESRLEIRKVDNSQFYPVTPTQKSMWEVDKYLNSKVFQLSFYQEVNIDAKLFKEAYVFVIGGYEIFKTVFTEDINGEIKQSLQHDTGNSPIVREIDYMLNDNPYSLVEKYITNDQKNGFDLSAGPLYKCILFKIKENRHILYFNIHHIICDGISLNVLRNKLFNSYKLLKRGENLIPENLGWQFKDYVTEIYNSNTHKAHQNYWKEKFIGRDIPELELRFTKKRPTVKTFNGSSSSIILKNSLYGKLLNIVEKTGCTLYCNLLSIVYIILYKNSSQKEIIIGCPISGRESVDMEDQIGCFVSTIPLKISMEDNFTYQNLVDRVKNDVFESFEYSFFSLENLKKDLSYEINPSRNPFFDITVVLLEDIYRSQEFLDNQHFTSNLKINDLSKNDMSFNFVQNENSLVCNLDYNINVFDKDSIELLLREIISLIENIGEGDKKIRQYLTSITDKKDIAEHNAFLEVFNDAIGTDF